ncbi:MAG: sugar transferase [Vicinamibacterales bacterium]
MSLAPALLSEATHDGAAVLLHDHAGTHVETGAGHDERLPRAFLIASDLLVLAWAFLVTPVVAPSMSRLLVPAGPVPPALREWLSLPAAMGTFQPLPSLVWVPIVTAVPLAVFLNLFGAYGQLVDQSRTRVLLSGVLAPLSAVAFLTTALFALKISSESRAFIFTFTLVAMTGLVTFRLALRHYKLRRLAQGRYARNLLLVGQSSTVSRLARHISGSIAANRYRFSGWLNVDNEPPAGLPAEAAGDGDPRMTCRGHVEQVASVLSRTPVHEVIAVQSSSQKAWLGQVIEACELARVRLCIVPDALLVGTDRALATAFRGQPWRLPAVVLTPPDFESDALFVKRLIDAVVSATLLLLLSPLMGAFLLLYRLRYPGVRAFKPQPIVGLKGRTFTAYTLNTSVQPPTRAAVLCRDLPLLWSVLRGDMSLVGPRPALGSELERYEHWHRRKLCVKPGLTCLWQLRGRHRARTLDEWVRLDLEYIDNWSLWLDVRILCRTAWLLLRGTH